MIGHNTGLSTSQVTATNLSRVTGGRPIIFRVVIQTANQNQGVGTKGEFFSKERKSLGNVWDHAQCFQVAWALLTNYFHCVTGVCGAYRSSDTNTGVVSDK